MAEEGKSLGKGIDTLAKIIQERTHYDETTCYTMVCVMLPWMRDGKFSEEMWQSALDGTKERVRLGLTDPDIFLHTMTVLQDHPEITCLFKSEVAE